MKSGHTSGSKIKYCLKLIFSLSKNDSDYTGTYKVRNEIETKRNETKRNEINENETKRNEINKNETKGNEINEMKTKQNEIRC